MKGLRSRFEEVTEDFKLLFNPIFRFAVGVILILIGVGGSIGGWLGSFLNYSLFAKNPLLSYGSLAMVGVLGFLFILTSFIQLYLKE